MRIKHVLRFLIVDLIKGVCERSLRASTIPCLALIYKYKYVWGPETCSFTHSYLDWLIIMASSASKYSSLRLLGLVPASCCFFQMLRPRVASAQNCECSSGLCCTGNDYCGDGCKQRPCYHANSSPTATSNANVASIITKDFFDGILAEADSSCAGKNFYTYDAFIAAANDKAFSGFGTTGTPDDSKRELAAFFAHVTHETRHFCYIEEIDGPKKDYCDESNTQYPCVSGKGYYGRGPIQLSWNFNYGPAGQDIGFDGLNEPEKVAEDASISFKTAVWYWMIHSDCHTAITSGKGFGATIRAINGQLECEGGPGRDAVATRIGYYQNYCQQLGVDPGDNLSC